MTAIIKISLAFVTNVPPVSGLERECANGTFDLKRQQLELTARQPEPVAVTRRLVTADEDDDAVLVVQHLVYLVVNPPCVQSLSVS
jgi:hypothetical protein